MTAEEIYESVTNGGSSDFADVAAILERMGRWCLIGGLAINASKPGSKLQLQFTKDTRYQDFIDRAQRREVLGNLIPIARLEDIMQGKIWAWKDPERRSTKRKKDELDLMRIAEAFPKLRPELPREIVDQITT